MRAQRQVCLTCHQDFTRKWNAQRHNKHAHSGEAKILPINYLRYGIVLGQGWTSQDNSSTSHSEETSSNRLIDVLEGIGTEFEECDRELQAFPTQIRQPLLGMEVYKAIISDNPKPSMKNSLKSIRRSCLSGKMIFYVSKAINLDSSTTEGILRFIAECKNYR